MPGARSARALAALVLLGGLPRAAAAQTPAPPAVGVRPALAPLDAQPVARAPGPVLRPGDARLETSWLADDSGLYTVRVVAPVRRTVGVATMAYALDGATVTSVVTVTLLQAAAGRPGASQTTTARADARTLAPHGQMSTGGAVETVLAFSADGVAGTRAAAGEAAAGEAAAGEAATVDVAFAAPVFDDAWTGVVAQSLPLVAGTVLTAEVYDEDRGVQPVTYTVAGPEDEAGRAVWTVRAATPAGPFTYAIDGATRRLLRMTFQPRAGLVVEMAREEPARSP